MLPAVDELDAATREWLRQLTRAHVRSWHGRLRVGSDLWIGRPRGPVDEQIGLRVGDDLDAALRFEIALALMERFDKQAPAGTPWMWLTRTGAPDTHDLDLAWLSGVLAAAAAASRDVEFVVVTRQGWYDPRSGAVQRWARVRG